MNLVSSTDPILRTPCAPVTDIATQVAPYVSDMLALMHAHDGSGLAAPQVGLPWRFFVASTPFGQPNVFINPAIVGHGKYRATEDEGCLSFPGERRLVTRYHTLDVRFTDLAGKTREVTLKGWDARRAAHEIDHLDGMCIVPPEPVPADLPGYDVP